MEDNKDHIPGIDDHLGEKPLYGFDNVEVHYYYDKTGGFGQKVTCHHDVTQELIKAELTLKEDRLEEMRQKVVSGIFSPIAYHMQRCMMDVAALAGYAGLSKRKVRKHLKPSGYAKLDDATRNLYARVFQIDVSELEKID